MEKEKIESMTPEESHKTLDDIYDQAVKAGLIKKMPKNYEECVEMYEAKVSEAATEVAKLRN